MPYDGQRMLIGGVWKIYDMDTRTWVRDPNQSSGTQGPGSEDATAPNDPAPPVGTTKPGPNGTTLVYLGYGNWDLYRPPEPGAGSTPAGPPPAITGTRPGPAGYIIITYSDGSEQMTSDPTYQNPPAPGVTITGTRPGPMGFLIISYSDGSEQLTSDPSFIAPPPPGVSIIGFRPGPPGYLIATDSRGNDTTISDPSFGVKPPTTSINVTSEDIGNNQVMVVTRDQDGVVVGTSIFDKALTPDEEIKL